MRTAVRLKLNMAARAMDFCRAHPDTSTAWAASMTRFEERLAHAQQLVKQQRAGDVSAHAAVVRRRELRDRLTLEPLTHLARIARAASVEVPEVANLFHVPSRRSNDQGFIGEVRRLADLAAANKTLFQSFGMPDTFLDDLNASIAEYLASATAANTAVAAHVGATTELDTVAEELLQVIAKLDAMVRFRFRDESGLLSAWTSARNIAWPAPEDVTPTPPATDKPSEGTKAA